jgi:hypothetical protein
VVNTKYLNLAHQYDTYLKPNQKASMIQISKVTYSKNNHVSLFENLIEKHLKLYVEIFGNTNNLVRENHIANLNLGTFQCVVILALLCKRPNYTWEQEIRAIVLLSRGFPSIHLYPDLNSRRFVDLLLETKKPYESMATAEIEIGLKIDNQKE